MITFKIIRDRLNRDTVYRSVEYWDDVAKSGYGKSGTLLYTNPHLNELYHHTEGEIIHSWMRDIRGKSVLDIGCGAGRYCREFAKLGARVDGIDFSAESIAIARRLTTEESVSYSVGSIYDLDRSDTYDYVICSRVLAIACRDASDVANCVGRIRAALKPGGRAIFVEPTHRSFMRRVLKMNLSEFQRELANAGLHPAETKVAECYATRMLLAYFRWPKWFTEVVFRAGEALIRVFPGISDQKFVLAIKS